MTATATRTQVYARLGPASRRWVYRDADGQVVGAVLRWEQPGGLKMVRPAALIGGEWTEGAMPEPRPLYRLRELLASPRLPVLVVEGEKAASAAIEALGDAVAVTTWAGGCGAVRCADWTPLHGRVVRIWPDADVPGAEAARQVAGHAWAAGAARILRLRVPAEWPKGHDAADLSPETVHDTWADPSRWEMMDVGGALERHRTRRCEEAARRELPRYRGRASEPSPEWARRVDAARSLGIVEIAQRLGCGDPVRRGRELVVRCPLHEDSDPSCTLDVGAGLWYCFPCGEGGDSIQLYMRARRLAFADAVREMVP